MYQAPNLCPTCQSALSVAELSCRSCGTTLRGDWVPSPFSQMSAEQQAFLVLFVRSRGNLSEVERALGVSYPTVRAKLEEVIQVLAGDEAADAAESQVADLARRELLARVARGEISTTEALAELQRRQQSEE